MCVRLVKYAPYKISLLWWLRKKNHLEAQFTPFVRNERSVGCLTLNELDNQSINIRPGQ